MEASRNPYVRTGTEPALMPSVVAYVDILGYREMALKAEREKKELEFLRTLHQAFSNTQKWLRGGDLPLKIGLKDFYAFRAFTDNVVIGYPIGGRGDAEAELGSIFLKLGIFQFEMTVAGFFVRGAISIGDVYIDDIVVFGKGFTEAYEGESRLARDPRIVLTASATEAVKKHLEYYYEPRFAWQYQDIYRDSDGQLFLNYLDCILRTRIRDVRTRIRDVGSNTTCKTI
jgi:hypothetical protein